MLSTYHLNALFDILSKVHFIYTPEELWKFILEQSCHVLQAEAATFYEMNEGSDELAVSAVCGIAQDRLVQLPFKKGTGICGWVAQYQQPALVNDVRQDHRFNKQSDLATGFETRSILCIPVFSVKRTFGAFEVLNRKAGLFTPQDQEFMTLLSRQAAIAYQNLLLLSEVQHKEILLQSLVESLSGGLIAADRQGKLLFLNPASQKLLALEADSFAGKNVEKSLSAYPWLIDMLRTTLTQEKTVSRQETVLTVLGVSQRIGYTTILISGPGNKVLGSGIIFQKLSN